MSGSKHCALAAVIGHHRSLVDYEYCVGVLVISQLESTSIGRIAPLAIDFTVNGKCRMTRVAAEHLCSTAGWSQQHGFHLH